MATFQSDVWSYGVTLWELFSDGRAPYPGMSNMDTVRKVAEGYRMNKPAACPEEVWTLIKDCWNLKPGDRPDFALILARLEQISKEYTVDVEKSKMGQRVSRMITKEELEKNLENDIYNN